MYLIKHKRALAILCNTIYVRNNINVARSSNRPATWKILRLARPIGSKTAFREEEMITDQCQRWRRGRTGFRPAGELFNAAQHEAVILTEREAKDFCCTHHYSGTMPVARFRVGLLRKMPFEHEKLCGVAVFSVPMQQAVLSKHLKTDVNSGAELGRFVLLDEVEGNGESWFLAAANRLLALKTSVRAVVSYADPVARLTADGDVLKPGHIGTIYQSTNARMVGRSAARTLLLTRDGRIISERTLSKIKHQETGSAYAYRQMIAAGAPERRHGEDPASYVLRAINEGPFKRCRHPGNLVYVYAVGTPSERRSHARLFAPAQPYPKALDFKCSPIILA